MLSRPGWIVCLIIFLFFSYVHASSIAVGFGGSSNPMQAPVGVGGSYSQISPVWKSQVLKTELSEWEFGLGGDFRKFSDDLVGSSADVSLVRVDLISKLHLIENFTTGFRIGAQKFMGRVASPRAREIWGDPNEFSEINYGVFGGLNFGPWEWLLDLGGIYQNYKFASYDDKENMFLDDHRDSRFKLSLSYRTERKFKIELVGIWNLRRYGEISGVKPISTLTPPPELVRRSAEIVQEDYFMIMTPVLDGYNAESSVCMGQDIDRTNGFVNQKRQKISQKFEFTLSAIGHGSIKFVPTVDVIMRSFPFYPIYSSGFVDSAPIPRQDFLVLVGAGLVVPMFSRVEGLVKLSRLESSSNSVVQNYSEDVVETGLSASF